ncbi:hypothetical protein Ddye_007813 [Dipteronia dyeriana]|uniref:Uncharacterized protein n=1 Tax=Dipteronia dyeriana TaxID=168575 RepID=A0AAD9XL61_9ROSI|nr:hypothetical protein Ddye_007813 [Dipteronia dyeriana]
MVRDEYNNQVGQREVTDDRSHPTVLELSIIDNNNGFKSYVATIKVFNGIDGENGCTNVRLSGYSLLIQLKDGDPKILLLLLKIVSNSCQTRLNKLFFKLGHRQFD